MTWFDTKNGQRLLDIEDKLLSDYLEDKFGYLLCKQIRLEETF